MYTKLLLTQQAEETTTKGSRSHSKQRHSLIRRDDLISTAEGYGLALVLLETCIGAIVLPNLTKVTWGDVYFQNTTSSMCNYKIQWVSHVIICSCRDLLRIMGLHECPSLTMKWHPRALVTLSACSSVNYLDYQLLGMG